MKFYGWRQGEWSDEDNGPASKHAKIKSASRRASRRHAKKRVRASVKTMLRRIES